MIELMVVIAIVGVLIGLLLPALSRSIGAGKRVVCSSNLRSLHTALTMYMDAGDGFLPFAEFPADFGRGFVEPYDELARFLDAPWPKQGDDGFERLDPWACPSDDAVARDAGTSYMYVPYGIMAYDPSDPGNRANATRLFFDDGQRVFGVGGIDPILFQDTLPFHGEGQPGKNGVRPDGSVVHLKKIVF